MDGKLGQQKTSNQSFKPTGNILRAKKQIRGPAA